MSVTDTWRPKRPGPVSDWDDVTKQTLRAGIRARTPEKPYVKNRIGVLGPKHVSNPEQRRARHKLYSQAFNPNRGAIDPRSCEVALGYWYKEPSSRVPNASFTASLTCWPSLFPSRRSLVRVLLVSSPFAITAQPSSPMLFTER